MEITGFFVLTLGTSTLGVAVLLTLSRLLRKGKKEGKIEKIERISKELNELYRSLSEQTYKSLNLLFLDKTKELLNGQKNFQNAFLLTEFKYASLYLEQFINSVKAKNKNPYLLYKAKHFIAKGMENIENIYLKNEIERMLLSLESFEGFS
ncbi:MAG: hypothetical protein QXX07_00695 [Candidatus Aenigmatarchaeota archaeon]